MACLITKGRATNCKDVVGGINRVWLCDYDGLGTITTGSNDEVTDATGTVTLFQYDVKGSGNTMVTTANVSRDAGTAYFSTVLSLSLPKWVSGLAVRPKPINAIYSKTFLLFSED